MVTNMAICPLEGINEAWRSLRPTYMSELRRRLDQIALDHRYLLAREEVQIPLLRSQTLA
jgi:hypothetical protein